MKKKYIAPTMEVVDIKVRQKLLTGSNVVQFRYDEDADDSENY